MFYEFECLGIMFLYSDESWAGGGLSMEETFCRNQSFLGTESPCWKVVSFNFSSSTSSLLIYFVLVTSGNY